MELNKQEALRYLGYRGRAADAETLDLLDSVWEAVLPELCPKNIAQEFPLTPRADGIQLGAALLTGQKLRRHLRGCRRAYVFAATLGAGADRLLRRYMAADSGKAAVAQAVLAAAIEDYCDAVCAALAVQARKRGLYLRPRFSPGYGDFPLEAQRDLFALCEITKRTGIVLTQSCLMLPTKSVTAVIGLSETETPCTASGCADCTQTDCAYRKVETKCDF